MHPFAECGYIASAPTSHILNAGQGLGNRKILKCVIMASETACGSGIFINEQSPINSTAIGSVRTADGIRE